MSNIKYDGLVKSGYLPALLRRKQAGMCHSEGGTTEESLKTNAPVQPDSSSQAPHLTRDLLEGMT